MTYTYADLEISQAAFDEIHAKMMAAGYHRAIASGALDMSGLLLSRALMPEDENPQPSIKQEIEAANREIARSDKYKEIP